MTCRAPTSLEGGKKVGMQNLGDAVHKALLSSAEAWGVETGLEDNRGEVGYQTDLAVERFRRRLGELGIPPQSHQDRIDQGLEWISKGLPLTQSPIEKRLLPELVFANYRGFFSAPAPLATLHDDLRPRGDIVIIPQFPWVRFRIDFMVIGHAGHASRIVAVECDGKGHHVDVMRDRKRDLFLFSWGIHVVRATGAEITTDAASVAGKVAAHLSLWKAMLRNGGG